MSSVSEQFPIRQGPGSEQASNDLSMALNEWLSKSGPSGLYRTCGSCRQMNRDPAVMGGATYCNKWHMTPPVDVVLKGCDAHEDEAEIPFPS